MDEYGYKARSSTKLNYNRDSIVESLKYSMLKEPIRTRETGEGSYIIFGNGLHRYTLLRIFCLSEIADARGDQKN